MSKAQEWPQGWQMPGPRAVQNLQIPHPGTDEGWQMPCSSLGERGGVACWAQLELTDALLQDLNSDLKA